MFPLLSPAVRFLSPDVQPLTPDVQPLTISGESSMCDPEPPVKTPVVPIMPPIPRFSTDSHRFSQMIFKEICVHLRKSVENIICSCFCTPSCHKMALIDYCGKVGKWEGIHTTFPPSHFPTQSRKIQFVAGYGINRFANISFLHLKFLPSRIFNTTIFSNRC